MKEETYTVKVSCQNCNWEGNIKVEKGTLATENPCPNCGCDTLVKPNVPHVPHNFGKGPFMCHCNPLPTAVVRK